jgi:putative salt-induced outer membrane protein YdiY
MTLLALAVASLLTQADAASNEKAAAAAERAAESAERAAVAAEKAAAALQKIAELQAAAAGVAPAPAAPAAPAAPPAEEKEEWKGLIGLGLISLTGNAESLTGTATAQADRKMGKWAFGIRAGGAYGQTRPNDAGADQVTAYRAMLSLRADRKIASFASLYALVGAETDHVKSVELRGYGEFGTGITFFEKKEGDLEKLFLRGDVAFRVAEETRFQYFGDANFPANTGLPSQLMVAPRVGLVFRYGMNKHIHFSEEAEILPNIVGDSRFLLNSTTKLNARLTDSLSISLSFLVTHDSAPAGNKRPTDTALSLGVEASF